MFKKVYPSIEECKIKNVVECTEKGCHKIFKSDSNLTLHLAKTHGKSELLRINEIKQYYCPESQCIYHKEKYLKNIKLLRQHYSKVHMKKDFSCTHCLMSFTSQKSFENHLPYCGVKFYCCDCGVKYPSYESLQTHGRRKKHNILSKQDYTLKIVSKEQVTSQNCSARKTDKLILPKPVNIIFISSNDNNLIQVKDQTSQSNQQIPFIVKPVFQTTATQTEEHFKLQKKSTNIKRHKTSSTQTDFLEVAKSPGKTDHGLNSNIMSSSSTQTSNFSFSITEEKIKSSLNNNSTAILGDPTITTGINNFEFDNCHMETQTDFIFDYVMFSNDYLMSNMYTQTCDDYLNQFSFNDIQTQTVFDDIMLKSVESQTLMSPKVQNNYGCKDMSHTETQTDAEFRQMLEEIDS